MQVIPWMEANVPGFPNLRQEEREAPMHFSLLWSYFEAFALRTHATTDAIVRWLAGLEQQGKLDTTAFARTMSYFRDRYVTNGQLNYLFDDLNLRGNDRPQLVRDMLLQHPLTTLEEVSATFIIIFRFRNNYIHGPKWGYEMRNQLQNFQVASAALMDIMDMAR